MYHRGSSEEPLDTSDKGYQPPLDESMVKEFDPEAASRAKSREEPVSRFPDDFVFCENYPIPLVLKNLYKYVTKNYPTYQDNGLLLIHICQYIYTVYVYLTLDLANNIISVERYELNTYTVCSQICAHALLNHGFRGGV